MLGTAVVVSALVAAGCGGGAVDGADPVATTVEPSTSSVPIPPTTVLTEEQAVLAAYQGYWDTWLAANDPPNPDHPDLERYATGAALAKVRDSITLNRSVGQILRLPDPTITEHRATVESIDGAVATVSDCSVDDGHVIANGSELVLDDSVATWSYEVLLRNEGKWKVAEVRVLSRADGAVECAG